MEYNWSLEDTDENEIAQYMQELNVTRILATRLIHKRIDTVRADQILRGDYAVIEQPLSVSSITEAASILKKYILLPRAAIYVFGDYDADGITSTVLLCHALEQMAETLNPNSASELQYYVPERIEGYGLSESFAKTVVRHAQINTMIPHLVITVDNGITAKKAVDVLLTMPNVEVLVTDHHEPDHENNMTPDCVCIDPCLEENSTGKLLAGCGVIFNVLRELEDLCSIDHGITDSLLYLPTIGTIGDMMKMDLYHSCLVQQGLSQINGNACPYWLAYTKELMKLPVVTAKDIAFSIAPFLNSCSQFGNVKIVLYALMSADEAIIRKYIDEMYDIYAKNKDETKRAKNLAEQEIAETYGVGHRFILYPMKTEYPGLVSKVATHLGKLLGKPLIVWGETENNKNEPTIAGSARNDTNFPAMQFMKDAVKAGLAESAEGHKYAFGVRLYRDKLPELQKFLDEKTKTYEERYGSQTAVCTKDIDCIISTADINTQNMEDLERFPFIKNLEAPIVMIQGAEIKKVQISKNNDKNLCYTICSPGCKYGIDIWAWNIKPEQYDKRKHTKIDMIGTLERNFMKPSYATLNVIDLRCY